MASGNYNLTARLVFSDANIRRTRKQRHKAGRVPTTKRQAVTARQSTIPSLHKEVDESRNSNASFQHRASRVAPPDVLQPEKPPQNKASKVIPINASEYLYKNPVWRFIPVPYSHRISERLFVNFEMKGRSVVSFAYIPVSETVPFRVPIPFASQCVYLSSIEQRALFGISKKVSPSLYTRRRTRIPHLLDGDRPRNTLNRLELNARFFAPLLSVVTTELSRVNWFRAEIKRRAM